MAVSPAQEFMSGYMGPKRKSTSEKILDAAEELFAQHQYDAVSVRQITGAAGVKLGLAHYHFSSKEDLFNAVIRRRIDLLTQSRRSLLLKFLEDNNGEPLPIEKLVLAFVTPYLYWSLNGGPGWRSYARLVSSLLGYNLKLLQELFDPGAYLFLQEMRRSIPKADESGIQWGFDFMVGLMCNTFSEVDRISGLSGGLCSTANIEEACRHMASFIAAGLSALAENRQCDFASTLETLKAAELTVPKKAPRAK